MRILVVEDDQSLREGMVIGLKQYGYQVDWLEDGQSAYTVLTQQQNREHFDAIILDLGLPGKSGDSVLKAMRERDIKTPVLILTANNSTDNEVAHLDLGADEYMVKPFDLKALDARLRNIIHRAQTSEKAQNLTLANITIDTAAHKVFVTGKLVEFSRREFTLLSKLIEQTGEW